MEGFETVGNIPATLHDLAEQGYTSRQRGGAVHARKGILVDEVQVMRGSELPPCIIAKWSHQDGSRARTGIRTFDDEEQLEQWTQEWDVRLSRHARRIVQN